MDPLNLQQRLDFGVQQELRVQNTGWSNNWLMNARKDEELLRDPFYIKYLDMFSPGEVASLINRFLGRQSFWDLGKCSLS